MSRTERAKMVLAMEFIARQINDEDVLEFMPILKSEISKYEHEGYSLMHGDLCFSNIFYDFTKKNIFVIDPRGQMFGSKYYEYAKTDCH